MDLIKDRLEVSVHQVADFRRQTIANIKTTNPFLAFKSQRYRMGTWKESIFRGFEMTNQVAVSKKWIRRFAISHSQIWPWMLPGWRQAYAKCFPFTLKFWSADKWPRIPLLATGYAQQKPIAFSKLAKAFQEITLCHRYKKINFVSLGLCVLASQLGTLIHIRNTSQWPNSPICRSTSFLYGTLTICTKIRFHAKVNLSCLQSRVVVVQTPKTLLAACARSLASKITEICCHKHQNSN